MKKTKKNALSPAPATVTSKPAPKAAIPDPNKIGSALPERAAAPAKAPAPPPNRIEAPAVPSPAPRAPAVPVATVITAKIDVGFGNSVYLRGEGPGLSWNSGLLLNNVASDEWTISLFGAKKPVVFKFLLNDATWNLGEDYVAPPGAKVTVRPEF
jgi:hypothetical protein